MKIFYSIILLFLVIQCDTYNGARIYRDLDKSIVNPQSVRYLELALDSLNSFPVEVLEMSNLEILNISYNNISRLPDDIDKLINLKILIIRNNPIVSLPNCIKNLRGLEKLDLLETSIKEQEVMYLKEQLSNCKILY